jgi:hypothetical protein
VCEVLRPFPPYAFMACTGEILPVPCQSHDRPNCLLNCNVVFKIIRRLVNLVTYRILFYVVRVRGSYEIFSISTASHTSSGHKMRFTIYVFCVGYFQL